MCFGVFFSHPLFDRLCSRGYRQFDGSRFPIALISGDGAVGQQQSVALSLRDHEPDFVDEEFTGLAEVIDLTGSVKKVDGNPDCLLKQERRRVVSEPG